jgi:hypothetical protein
MMGLLTWAKCKLEKNWPASLSEAIMKVKGFSNVGHGEKSSFKKDNKFPHKKTPMKGNGIEGKTPQKGKSPNISKVRDALPTPGRIQM